MNCMFDAMVIKTVLFVSLLYMWTEFAWINVASGDLIVRRLVNMAHFANLSEFVCRKLQQSPLAIKPLRWLAGHLLPLGC